MNELLQQTNDLPTILWHKEVVTKLRSYLPLTNKQLELHSIETACKFQINRKIILCVDAKANTDIIKSSTESSTGFKDHRVNFWS